MLNALNLLLYRQIYLIIPCNQQLRESSQICKSLTNFHTSLTSHISIYDEFFHRHIIVQFFCSSFIYVFPFLFSFALALRYVKLLYVLRILIFILEGKHFRGREQEMSMTWRCLMCEE